MTTIVIDTNYILATDSRGTYKDGTYNDDTNKIYKVRCAYIVGAGNSYHIQSYISFYQHKLYVEEEYIDLSLCTILVVFNGEVYKVTRNEDSQLTLSKSPLPIAIGSGSSYAYEALSSGKNASDAILHASKYDHHTGGPVKTISLINKTILPIDT